jgi:uncharacterized protein YjbI with pentapeptide repeats
MTNKYTKATNQFTLSKPQPDVENEEAQKNPWKILGSGILYFLEKLMIPACIPLTVLGGTYFINDTNQKNAGANREQDRKIADDQVNQKTLDQYVEDVSKLLFDRKLRNAKLSDEVYKVAKARTLSVLPGLDGKRKVQLISFLNDVKLFEREKEILSLRKADLSNVNFDGLDLNGIDLTEAKLSGAKLAGAKLAGATLDKAVFAGVGLKGLNFNRVSLIEADFRLANWNLNHGANFSNGRGSGSEMIFFDPPNDKPDADFTEANLTGAIMPDAPEHARLCRTKMPDGTINNRDCAFREQR